MAGSLLTRTLSLQATSTRQTRAHTQTALRQLVRSLSGDYYVARKYAAGSILTTDTIQFDESRQHVWPMYRVYFIITKLCVPKLNAKSYVSLLVCSTVKNMRDGFRSEEAERYDIWRPSFCLEVKQDWNENLLKIIFYY